ncbi:hypothetical protein BH24ACT5_BH24ACT5_08090 [soil metagenome]
MSTPRDSHGLGYERVDQDPNVAVLIATMDATSRWDATRALRAWERVQLHLTEGERLLDVGCGLGDAALTLGEDLGAVGEVVGVDASMAMLTVAQKRSRGAACHVRFSVGDALALEEPDESYDAARSERTLQWVTDPQGAIDELARVLRPAGRISLIDTDWSTFRLDAGDNEIAAMVREAVRTERGRPSNVGSRLGGLIRAAGFHDVRETTATNVWNDWDPDESPAPDGLFSMRSLADDLVATGQLDHSDTDRFVSTIEGAARRGHFSMRLTMFAAIATAPTRHASGDLGPRRISVATDNGPARLGIDSPERTPPRVPLWLIWGGRSIYFSTRVENDEAAKPAASAVSGRPSRRR